MPNEVPFLKYELGKGTLISSIVFSCYPNQNKHWHARRIFFFWSGFNKLEFFFFFEDFDYFIYYEFNLFGHFVKLVKVLGDKQLLSLKRTTNIIFIFHDSLSPTRVNCEKRYLVYKLSDFIYSLLYEKKILVGILILYYKKRN